MAKRDKHHWWPKSLSKFWADDDGCVHQIFNDGTYAKSQPKTFGATHNANKILVTDNWHHDFEPEYQRADEAFPWLVPQLHNMLPSNPPDNTPISQRLFPLVMDQNTRDDLGECLASLITRSPSFRQRIRQGIGAFHKMAGDSVFEMTENLVAMNVRNAQSLISGSFRRGGKLVLLFCKDSEFIFGDGFLHNLYSAERPSTPRCLVPLTPNLAVFYTKPIAYKTFPETCSLNLRDDEVAFINETVQVYSRQYLYFKSVFPTLSPSFEKAQHERFQNDSHPWIDELGHAAGVRRAGRRVFI